MAKQNNAAQDAAENNTALEVAGKNQIEAAFERFADVEALESKDLIELSSSYLKFEENKTYDLIATGFTNFVDEKGEEKEAVSLINKDRESLINANAVLVSSLKKIGAENLPCFIRVVTAGKIKGANGTYQAMKVLRGPAVN